MVTLFVSAANSPEGLKFGFSFSIGLSNASICCSSPGPPRYDSSCEGNGWRDFLRGGDRDLLYEDRLMRLGGDLEREGVRREVFLVRGERDLRRRGGDLEAEYDLDSRLPLFERDRGLVRLSSRPSSSRLASRRASDLFDSFMRPGDRGRVVPLWKLSSSRVLLSLLLRFAGRSLSFPGGRRASDIGEPRRGGLLSPSSRESRTERGC